MMPEYTIREVVGKTLNDRGDGFDKPPYKRTYLVLRDGVRVRKVRECESWVDAYAAIRKLEEADSKTTTPR